MSGLDRWNEDALPFEPRSEWVVLKVMNALETPGGVALPEGAGTEWSRGKVVAKGPGRFTEEGVHIPINLDVGDEVHMMFSSMSAKPLVFDHKGDKYIVVREREIVGVYQRVDPNHKDELPGRKPEFAAA